MSDSEIKQNKRSGVKEMVAALTREGVSIDDVVIRRDPDGTMCVYKRSPAERTKLSDLDKWRAQNAELAQRRSQG